jgi:hypothetical protein
MKKQGCVLLVLGSSLPDAEFLVLMCEGDDGVRYKTSGNLTWDFSYYILVEHSLEKALESNVIRFLLFFSTSTDIQHLPIHETPLIEHAIVYGGCVRSPCNLANAPLFLSNMGPEILWH